MIPMMWLIVEGDSDPKVMQRILDIKGIKIKVNRIRPSGGGGIPRLAEELEDLLNGAIRAKKHGDCIVVLHDADELQTIDARHRQHYKDIDATCQSDKFKDQVTLVVAHYEIESWLLADNGLCKWLKIPTRSNCDSIPKPSVELDRAIRKHNPRMGWNGRYWDAILKNIDGTGDKLSQSMRISIETLRHLPCTQTKTLETVSS